MRTLWAIHVDHLVDAVDLGDDATGLPGGRTVTIPTGSWIVNCTGYLWESPDGFAPAPYVSPRGSVLRIQPRVATFVLSSFIGYYVTHLFLLDKAREVPLYEIDFTLSPRPPGGVALVFVRPDEFLIWVLSPTSYPFGLQRLRVDLRPLVPQTAAVVRRVEILALRKRLRPPEGCDGYGP